MGAEKSFPAPNFDLSPYTGWTREHWVALLARLTHGFVRWAERNGSPARALFPEDLRGLPDSIDGLEAFARMAPAWAAWLHNPTNPTTLDYQGREIDLAALLRQGLLDGTNPDQPGTYWGEMDHLSQHVVETADLAVAVWLSRERVFDRMTSSEQLQVMAWLAKVDDKRTYFDNWILFPALPLAVRRKLGYPASELNLDGRLESIDAFYRGDGWYADGPGNEFELYNAWMFGWHYLLWAWIDGERRPDQRERVLQRSRSFLAGFQHFFGSNGSYPAWGRSIVYRFSAISTFAVGYLLGIAPSGPGMLRRLSSGCMRYFYEHGFIDPVEDYILQGYHGRFPQAGESYISPGSPYWACHAFFALAFSQDDPFWSAVETPLPVEQADFDLALPAPGFVLRGVRSSGQVLLLNSRAGQPEEVVPDASREKSGARSEIAIRYGPRHDYPSKYGKFAYSTHFPFNVAPIPDTYVPDAMLALSADDISYGHRGDTRSSQSAPGMIWCEFDEEAGEHGHTVRTAVLLWKDLQVRVSWIQPGCAVRAWEGPGALGCSRPAAILRRSDASAGWEYAEVEGRSVGIQRLLGYDNQRPSAPFRGQSNVNLAYPHSEMPLVFESRRSSRERALAAISLLRPGSFDPAAEFADFRLGLEAPAGFRLEMPGNEIAWICHADDPPASLRLGEFKLEGNELRMARLSLKGEEFCAAGIQEIAGVVELDAPGTLHLQKVSESEARVCTDRGLRFSPEWLGGPLSRCEAQDLAGKWVDLTAQCSEYGLPEGVVRDWSARNQRQLVTFQVKR